MLVDAGLIQCRGGTLTSVCSITFIFCCGSNWQQLLQKGYPPKARSIYWGKIAQIPRTQKGCQISKGGYKVLKNKYYISNVVHSMVPGGAIYDMSQ